MKLDLVAQTFNTRTGKLYLSSMLTCRPARAIQILPKKIGRQTNRLTTVENKKFKNSLFTQRCKVQSNLEAKKSIAKFLLLYTSNFRNRTTPT